MGEEAVGENAAPGAALLRYFPAAPRAIPIVDDASSPDVDAFGQALGQHLLRGTAPDGNSDSAQGDIQLRKDSAQPFEAW